MLSYIRKFPQMFSPAAKPSGPITVYVVAVVGVVVVVGGSSLHVSFYYTLLRHYKFASGWDPPENGSQPVSSR